MLEINEDTPITPIVNTTIEHLLVAAYFNLDELIEITSIDEPANAIAVGGDPVG